VDGVVAVTGSLSVNAPIIYGNQNWASSVTGSNYSVASKTEERRLPQPIRLQPVGRDCFEADPAVGPTWRAGVVGTRRGLSNRSLTGGRADYEGKPRTALISRVR
jgi:hypothetical protein